MGSEEWRDIGDVSVGHVGSVTDRQYCRYTSVGSSIVQIIQIIIYCI